MTKSIWMGMGFTYEFFVDGYYIDDTGSDIHTAIEKTDEKNKLAIKLATGLYSFIGSNTIITPGLSVRYNLPTESFTFDTSDILIGVNLSIGTKMDTR
jgi:hypothetical protein